MRHLYSADSLKQSGMRRLISELVTVSCGLHSALSLHYAAAAAAAAAAGLLYQ
jgi:hypothetical protein